MCVISRCSWLDWVVEAPHSVVSRPLRLGMSEFPSIFGDSGSRGRGFSTGIECCHGQCLCKVDIFWDLSAAKFGLGTQPLEGYYVTVFFNLQMVFLLVDLAKEAHNKTTAWPSVFKCGFGGHEGTYIREDGLTMDKFIMLQLGRAICVGIPWKPDNPG